MNLKQVRREFVRRTGREDLVHAGYGDNGANLYIQSGQRTLDRMLEMDKSWARAFKTLAAGDYYAIFKGCRAIKRVWIATATDRSILEKVTLQEMRELYTDPLDEIDQGDTLRYCVTPLRVYPDDGTDTIIDLFYGSELAESATEEFEYQGIIFLPPPEEAATLEVLGLFYSTPLNSDTEESYWTVNHPEILLMAAQYHLEVSYRNSEGAKDWMTSIEFEVKNMEKDFIETEIAEIDQIVN
jgi:hypothetical protein